MAFIKLTRHHDGETIQIHFRHIVSVSKVGGVTKVHTTGLHSDGSGLIWSVSEGVDHVVGMVDDEELRRL